MFVCVGYQLRLCGFVTNRLNHVDPDLNETNDYLVLCVDRAAGSV